MGAALDRTPIVSKTPAGYEARLTATGALIGRGTTEKKAIAPLRAFLGCRGMGHSRLELAQWRSRLPISWSLQRH